MKKLLCISLFLIMLFPFVNVHAEDISLDAEAAILIDGTSGTVLYEKNSEKKMYPASITKILTGYLVLDKGLDMNELCDVSKTAIESIDRRSSHIFLTYDEKVKVNDLLYAMLLQSANDASNVLAEKVSGSIESFVELMNQTIEAMGLKNTHFTNPHGLPNDKHYTTAYDIATIMRYALQNDKFKEIIKTTSFKAEPTNKLEESRIFANGNNMIKKGKYYYEPAIGGKTGWTEYAGYTFVGAAKKDGTTLIVALFNNTDEDARYKDAVKLFDYGFNNFKTMRIDAAKIENKIVEIYKGKKLAHTVTFSMPYSFDILVSNNATEDSVTFNVEVFDEDNIDKVSGYLNIYLHNEFVGKIKMEKSVESYDISFESTTLNPILKYLNYFSVFVLGIFVLLYLKKIVNHR